MSRKICIVTGTRAEYGLLYWVMKDLQTADDFELQIIATGMHLSPEFGHTIDAIIRDGFSVDAKVENLVSSDTGVGVAKSIGLGTIGFADAYERLQPDLIIVLGDRFEILAAAQTALVMRVPLAHFCGGDVTEGAFDESIRHSITKMSHLHFVSNAQSGKRVAQLGESPEHIHVVGNPGLDHIKRTTLLTDAELEASLGITFNSTRFMITYHPVTATVDSSVEEFKQLLDALDEFAQQKKQDVSYIFSYPNADTEGRALIAVLNDYVATREYAHAFKSLGQQRYLSMLNASQLVVGNSSSGIAEAPSIPVATINIGDRQKGRLSGDTVIHTTTDQLAILKGIQAGLKLNIDGTMSPYGNGGTSKKVIQQLRALQDFKPLLAKPFRDLT